MSASAQLKTYVTSTEMSNIMDNWQEYTDAEQTYALQQSYLLTNSYIKPEVAIPPIEIWDGIQNTTNAPAILKHAQIELCKYLLYKKTYTWTEDLQNMFNSVVEMLRGINAGELGIESQTFSNNVGAHIVYTKTVGSGSLEVLNSYAGYEDEYVIEIDTTVSGTYYPYGEYNQSATTYPTFKWRTISSNWTEQNRCTNEWVAAGKINIRFLGSLSAGDMWTVKAIPQQDVNSLSNESKEFKQKFINY